MKKIEILVAMIILITVGYMQRSVFLNLFKSPTAFAAGDLTIDWGVAGGTPLFSISNAVPGQSISKTVSVHNNATLPRPLGISGIIASQSGNLAHALDITISDDGTPVYGQGSPTGTKTLAQFFAESALPNFVALPVLNSGKSTSLSITIMFDPTAGNEYQGKSATFSLSIGVAYTVPQQCENMHFNSVIFGTEGNDTIHAGSGNTLILGFEGKDKLYGGSGNDCIVGGLGTVLIDGSSGNDVLISSANNVKLTGDSGNDILIASGTNTIANGGTGVDTCTATKKINCEK